jgi:methionine sulfoxide reductase heme-binding subunit
MDGEAVEVRSPASRAPDKLAWLKPSVFLGSMTPLLSIIIRFVQGQFIDPVAESLNLLGLLALIFIIASLACTPLQMISGWAWPLRLRKLLGLFAFFYALLHFIVYAAVDQGFDFKTIFEDITTRKFIAVGFIALVLMVPLAATSTGGAIRRMGAQRWKNLHKLAYVAAILGVIHFVWRVKSDYTQPIIYGGILAVLLAIRLLKRKSS